MGMEKLEGSKGCFVCDKTGTNTRSLGVTLYWDDESRQTVIPFTPEDSWCGYEGIVHGGILTALCDDVMAWSARQTSGEWAVTANISLRFLRPVESGKNYTASGNATVVEGRKIHTEARIINEAGKVCADARAVFVAVKNKETGNRIQETEVQKH
ncbi:MAG: PaaI family thioesterase [Thermovirgaceae bacterium]|nr:PaaI family thioesterase [Thermovirgaceae bacterium]